MNPREPSARSARLFASVWLVYLVFVFVEPYMARAGWAVWSASVLATVLFLPLYYAVFSLLSSRPRHALAAVVAIAVLGLLLTPINVGGTTFLIYSAALAGFVMTPRRGALYLGALVLGFFAVLVVSGHPFQPWMWFQLLALVVVGGANLAAGQERRRELALRRAQEDVEAMATLAERERIARDLHDVLGHTLSVIVLKSELASRLAHADPERAAREIRDVERVARQALTDVRGAIEGYRQRGFQGELRNAEEALRAAGVSVSVEVPSPAPTLAARQETALALALREAATNIVRHAAASACRISLTSDKDAATLRIEDDGVGGTPHEGSGLQGMRERLRTVGGSLVVAGDRGLTLTMTVPRQDQPRTEPA